MMVKKLFSSSSAKTIWKKVVDYIIGAAVGAVFGTLFSSAFLQALIFAFVLVVILVIHIILSNRVDSRCDILKILNNELKSNHYVSVIRIGHALSRPLHLSGRRTLLNEIGHLTNIACDHLGIHEKILIDDSEVLIGYIKAKTLIDNLGWTSFELNRCDSAIDNISAGIEIAIEIKNYKLAVKGYRHLIGILNKLHKDELKEEKRKEALKIIESQNYKNSFNNAIDYEHAKAEFDYAYARTLIDSEPKEALEIAQKVQYIFKTDTKNDRDRYVKTFDLIGDIYARSQNPKNLKKAKDTYFEGISKCELCGRTERLLRIAEDYLSLLIKMTDIQNIYNYESWQDIDKQEEIVYKKAIDNAKCIENGSVKSNFVRLHKRYLKARKKLDKNKK